jgi:RNA polymerase sigma-70 factor, ECF subfamily
VPTVTTHEFGEVLAAAQDGAPWAVAVLWNDLHPRLLRFLRGLDPSAAEDVEADTWLAAARDLGTFHGDNRQFRAWMFTIARNRLIDYGAKRADGASPCRRRSRASDQVRMTLPPLRSTCFAPTPP